MSQISQDTSHPHQQEIEQVFGALSKITSRTPDEIKPHLNALLNLLGQEEDLLSASFYETSTHEEWSKEFHEWVDSWLTDKTYEIL